MHRIVYPFKEGSIPFNTAKKIAEVAQLAEASGLDPECWEFESLPQHQHKLTIRSGGRA